MSKVVGIDLGTTNSLVAYVKDGVPIIIRDKDGDGLVPSVVSVAEDNTIYVGREAQRRLLTDAKRTAYSVKRFMGKGREDVRHEAEHFPFRVGGETGSVVRIGLGAREFTPPEISAFILRELKHRAEAFFPAEAELAGARREVMQESRKAVIQAKLDLSAGEETTIRIDYGPPEGVRDQRRLTRAEFESVIQPIVDRTLGPCHQALADAGLEPSQVDEVVLVGGSTRIPLVRRKVEALFGRAPHTELNPDEVVALGAAIQADILITRNREMLLLDVTPLSLGIET